MGFRRKRHDKNNSQTNYTAKKENDPIQILKMRLAKGEITKEEYEELKKVLE